MWGFVWGSFVWNVFLSSFGLTFCVCFYELGDTATSSGLEGVTLSMSNPCVDCVCQVVSGRLAGIGAGMVWGRPRMFCVEVILVGWLELEWA